MQMRSSPRIPRQLLRRAMLRNGTGGGIRRMDEDVPRFAEACLSAEFAPHGCGLGKVAGADVMPNLIPLGWRQYPPQGLVRSYETIEPRGPILAGPTRRLVEEEDPAGADGATDCFHQAQLVL